MRRNPLRSVHVLGGVFHWQTLAVDIGASIGLYSLKVRGQNQWIGRRYYSEYINETNSGWFFPDQTAESCRVAEYIYDNIGRNTAMAEDIAREQREKYSF